MEMQARYPSKIIVTSFMGGDSMKAPNKILQDGGISNYDFPEPAIQSIRAVCDYAYVRSVPVASAAVTDVCGLSDTTKRARITAIFDLVRSEKRNVLLSHETSEIF